MKKQPISPQRHAANLNQIHADCQMRIMFRHFYPSDGPDHIKSNQDAFQNAIEASPDDREVMATKVRRRNWRSLAIAVSALILLRLSFLL